MHNFGHSKSMKKPIVNPRTSTPNSKKIISAKRDLNTL